MTKTKSLYTKTALVLACCTWTLAGASPAASLEQQSLATEVERSVNSWTGPSLRLHVDGSLEVRGEREGRVLLLFGDLDPGSEKDGRRVQPRGVVELDLDLDGRRLLPAQGLDVSTNGSRRVFVQAWQRSAASAPGAFSIPINLSQRGTSQASIARPGDLVVTEFMKDPTAVTDSHGEWIELRSNKSWRLDIEGVTVSDLSGASFTLDNGGLGILLKPGERFVVGNDTDRSTNGDVPVDWKWSSFSLKNSSDEIFVHTADGRLLDWVIYDDGVRWPDAAGMSISLTHPISDSATNNDPALWCSSTTAMGNGADTGTPGAQNDVCP